MNHRNKCTRITSEHSFFCVGNCQDKDEKKNDIITKKISVRSPSG